MADWLNRLWTVFWVFISVTVNIAIYWYLGLISYAIAFGLGVLIAAFLAGDISRWDDAIVIFALPFLVIFSLIDIVMRYAISKWCKAKGFRECRVEYLGYVSISIDEKLSYDEYLKRYDELRAKYARKLKLPKFLVDVKLW